jgi:glucosamine--fructose-6-phosphate aminotransferase (isomerizing)
MCGIVAYFGRKPAQPILIEGLKRLEYRGYDSAGIALLEKDRFSIYKTPGRISNLEETLPTPPAPGGLGHRPHPLGHTRQTQHCQCTSPRGLHW